MTSVYDFLFVVDFEEELLLLCWSCFTCWVSLTWSYGLCYHTLKASCIEERDEAKDISNWCCICWFWRAMVDASCCCWVANRCSASRAAISNSMSCWDCRAASLCWMSKAARYVAMLFEDSTVALSNFICIMTGKLRGSLTRVVSDLMIGRYGRLAMVKIVSMDSHSYLAASAFPALFAPFLLRVSYTLLIRFPRIQSSLMMTFLRSSTSLECRLWILTCWEYYAMWWSSVLSPVDDNSDLTGFREMIIISLRHTLLAYHDHGNKKEK